MNKILKILVVLPAIAFVVTGLRWLVAPAADGMAAERDCFLALRQSEQAKALRHLFFAERGAKAPAALANHMPKIINQAVVVGGGTMGSGIAHALVRAGITTVTLEANEAAAKQAAARAESLIEAGVKRGLIGAQLGRRGGPGKQGGSEEKGAHCWRHLAA